MFTEKKLLLQLFVRLLLLLLLLLHVLLLLLLFRIFREAIEERKHSIPSLIGAAISMVTIVTIPWAVRRIRERKLQNKLQTCLEKLVLHNRIYMHT